MTPERWRQITGLFEAASRRDPRERPAFLAAACGEDAVLLAEVQSLLEAQRDDTVATGGTPGGSHADALLDEGREIGPYRIVRLLGCGGMGAVYQAEEVDSGRQVALKVLRQRLDNPRAREQFQREGRLAASLNDPHCVFVFGASEIDGRLTIAMELMHHTLADRLKSSGRLSPAAAVDAALQLVSGLRAASAVGILHRDVKPSNCFVDADGVVKIGDFGISRSLYLSENTTVSTRGQFAATPAYAAPEQLRGRELDIRADVYSLGATLYELLTGRTPFEHEDLMALLMAVANDAPTPPHRLTAAVPRGLSRVVLRCLAKRPEERFVDYDAVAAALAPYSSTAATPATLGRRFFAGVIDQSVVAHLSAILMVSWSGPVVSADALLGHRLAWFISLFVYYGLAEGVWARTPGKLLVGLIVVDSNGRPPRAWRLVARAALFAAVWTTGGVLDLASDDGAGYASVFVMPFAALIAVSSWVQLVAVFSTARRSNRYGGWHDLATGTRVVERAASNARQAEAVQGQAAVVPKAFGRVGPFQVVAGTVTGLPAGWRPGFDDCLRRRVWIREMPPGAPPLDRARMSVSRPTRLRWLAGQRAPHTPWDAFEAVPGVPLEQACARPRSWADVRWWLLDLARECAAQTPEDHSPLRIDRVWILERGGAKLVDDPVVDRAERVAQPSPDAGASLLLDVVRVARGASPAPWPLSAQRFVDRLRADRPPSIAAIIEDLEPLTRQRAMLTRGWRTAHTLGLVAVPLLVVWGSAILRASSEWALHALPHEVRVVSLLLDEHRLTEQGIGDLSSQDLEAIEVVLASRYRHVLTDPRMFTADYAFAGRNMRSRIPRVLSRQPSETEVSRALERDFVRMAMTAPAAVRSGRRALRLEGRAGILMFTRGLTFVALLSVVVAAALRGGMMRTMGLEIVTADGRPASRRRILARTVIAMAPVLMLLATVHPGPIEFAASTVVLLVMLAGTVVAIVHPTRGIQDRLAGTWIVPR